MLIPSGRVRQEARGGSRQLDVAAFAREALRVQLRSRENKKPLDETPHCRTSSSGFIR